MKTVAGLFPSMTEVRKAMEHLSAHGFSSQVVTASERPATQQEVAREVAGDSFPYQAEAVNVNIPPAGFGVLPLNSSEKRQMTSIDAGEENADTTPTRASSVDSAASTLRGGVHEALVGYGFSDVDIQDIEAQMKQGYHLLAADLVGDVGEPVIQMMSQEGARQMYIGTRFAAVR